MMIGTCMKSLASHQIPRVLVALTILFVHSSVAMEVRFEDVDAEDVREVRNKFQKLFESLENRASRKFPNFIPLAQIDSVVKQLHSTQKYETVEARRISKGPDDQLVFVAIPVQLVESIIINGASEVDDDDILERLGIQVNQPIPKNRTQEAVSYIEELYKENGFLGAKIQIRFVSQSAGKSRVEVNIAEGPPTLIEKIIFETSNLTLKSQLEEMVKSELKDEFRSNSIADIRAEILEHFTEHRYLNASLSEPEVVYSDDLRNVQIRFGVENPYSYFILYEGNSSIDSVSLSKALRLNSSERFGVNPSAELLDRLRNHYQSQGFANVKVTSSEEIVARDYVKKLRLKVEEGHKVRIGGIEVNGKISRDSKYYSKFIKEHSSTLIELGYYNIGDLELGYKNLITDLQNQGFLQAKFLSARSEFIRKGEYVNIKVFIDEGPQTIIRSIGFRGLKSFSESELLAITGLKSGEALSLNVFESSIGLLREFFASRGYLDMKINEEATNFIKYNELHTEAQIEYEIQEGPKVHAASILIQGNEQTKDNVILREIDFKEGEILTSSKVSESEFRLQKLGLFSSVVIRTLEQDTQISQRTVIIEVVERNPGLFNIGGSLNNEFGDQYAISFTAYSGIAYRNLMGTARALSLRGEVNYNLESKFIENVNLESKFIEYDVTLSYLEPFIFGDRIRGRVNFTRSVRIFKSELERAIALETNQVTNTLDKDLSRTVKFTWNLYSLAYTRKYAFRGRFNEENLAIATVGPQLDWDLRDHPFSPSKGIFYRITGDYSNPTLGSSDSVHFYKLNSGLSAYLPLGSPKFVWANSVRGGYLSNLISTGRVPEEVMFSLGGRSTIRGFDPQAIPNRTEFAQKMNQPGDNPMFVRESSHYYLFKSEFRFPFWGDFGGVLFYDGGLVHVDGIQFQDEYRDAAGVGFRYNTPVGPVSAELAFKLDRRDSPVPEPPFRFHFSIGAF